MAFSISMSEQNIYETEALAAHYRIIARAQRMKEQFKKNGKISFSIKDLQELKKEGRKY